MAFRVKFYFFVSLWMLTATVSFAQKRNISIPAGFVPGRDYAPHTLIVKIKPANTSYTRLSSGIDPLSQISSLRGVSGVEKAVAQVQPPKASPHARRTPSVDIENIYRVSIQDGQNLQQIIQQLMQMDQVVYAEPYYLLKPLGVTATEYVPNDPQAAKSGGAQAYLSGIKAYEAWAIEKGDSSITIGILDTGIEYGHQDLSDNLKRNHNDPINGLDDDGDGFTDNFHGWDFSDGDNEPIADQNNHGILVSGAAAATTDNKVGIAGTGFRSSYMPIKIFSSVDGAFHQGYEAIAYAADMGCKVINLSWGGANAFSYFGQDMINYAVLEKDAVVVAAAGNSGKFEDFYPASFDNVLSVAQSDNNGNRISATSHSYFVDLMAPGQTVYTTDQNDSYRNATGSSLATPLVAGTAALMRAKYPELSARQIIEKLRLSTDDMYTRSANSSYQEKLGRGFLNMKKALTAQQTPAIRMTAFSYKNHVGAYAFYGDTLEIKAEFFNFLSPAKAASVTLSSPSEYVTVLDSVYTLGPLDSLASVSNQAEPFRVYLHEDLPASEQLYFRLAYQDGSFSDYQYFYIVSSPDYGDVDNGQIQLAIGSQGAIGNGLTRNGLIYQGDTLAKHLGFILAAGEDSVSDNTVSDFQSGTYSNDFVKSNNIRFTRSSTFDQVLASVFDDAAADNPLSLRVEQNWLTDTIGTAQQFLISEYRITNRSSDSLFSLYPALFADWDIGNRKQNRAGWDATYQLAYAHDDNQYSGIALLTGQSAVQYAIDKLSLNGNIADFEGNFTDSLHYAWLSTDAPKAAAGMQGAGNDIAQLMGAAIDTLPPSRHIQLAFAWVFGTSLAELQQQANLAKEKYLKYRQNPPVSQTVYVCTESSATIVPPAEGVYRFYRDALGTDLLKEGSTYITGSLTSDTAIFMVKVVDSYEQPISQVDIRMLEPQAVFTIKTVEQGSYRSDTLFLNTTDAATLTMEDLSSNAVAWQWDFGNGFKSTRQQPSVKYSVEGSYNIRLRVSSAAGCESDVVRTLTVIRKAEKPLIQDQLVCRDEAVTLSAANTSQIKVYSDILLSTLIYEGDTFVSGAITQDSVFYVVNASSVYESIAVAVQVKVIQPAVNIAHALDLSGQDKYLLKLWALPKDEIYQSSGYEWFIGDNSIGSGDTIIYDYSLEHTEGQDFEVRLNFTRTDGSVVCQQETSKLIDLNQSPSPVLENLRVCRGEAIGLNPTNGKNFFFYTDASLSEPVFKGSSYQVGDVQGAMTFYITNMDSLQESQATEVQVVLKRFADFSLSQDTLFLQENQEVVFEGFLLNNDYQEVSWQWDLGDGQLLNRGARVTQVYDSVGEYQIRMVARTQDGCSNTVTKTLLVKNITSVEHALENQSLLLYPNPSSGIFILSNERWSYKKIMLHLYDTRGKALCHEQLLYDALPVKIDLHQMAGHLLPEGAYLLQLQVEGKLFTRQILLKSTD